MVAVCHSGSLGVYMNCDLEPIRPQCVGWVAYGSGGFDLGCSWASASIF